jgi:hypothetical protein
VTENDRIFDAGEGGQFPTEGGDPEQAFALMDGI